MAFDKQAALAAGYTEEEIAAFLQANPKLAQQTERSQPGASAAMEPPPPSTVVDQPTGSMASGLATMAAAAAPYLAPTAATVAGGAAAYYGLKKGGEAIGAVKRGLSAVEDLAQVNRAREARLQNRPGFGGTPQTQAMVQPQAQPQPNNVRPIRPVAPQTMAQPRPQPNMLQQGMQYAARIKDLAMQRVVQPAAQMAAQVAPAAARIGTGVGAALYSPGLNTGEEEYLRELRLRAQQGQLPQ